MGAPMVEYLLLTKLQVTSGDTVPEDKNEIVHIAWMVFDVILQRPVDQHEVFVKPEWTKCLSSSFNSATGITNEQIQNAASLASAIQQIDSYLTSNFANTGKKFLFVTDGIADFKKCLPREAALKGIDLQPHYKRFVDLQAEVRMFYSDITVSDNLNSINEALGLPISPQLFGLKGCEAMVNIVQKMLGDGYQFEGPSGPSDDDDHIIEDATAQGADSHTSGVDSTVRLRGLPYSATASDIARFFAGLTIAPNGVFIPVNLQGRPTGDAFVQFSTSADADTALNKFQRAEMQSRYIEIFKSSKEEVEQVKAAQHNAPQNLQTAIQSNPDASYTGVLRLRGLPYSAGPQEISEFFSGFQVVPNGIYVVAGLDGRPTGEAFVEFASEDQARAAQEAKDRQKISSRYIELFKATKGDLYMYLTQRNVGPPVGLNPAVPTGPPGLVVPGTAVYGEHTCVRLRGLPFIATANEIAEFFHPVNAAAITVHIVNNQAGRPSGEAFVEFATPAEAERAILRHKQNLGNRYVEVFRSTRTEMATAMAMAAYQLHMDPNIVLASLQHGLAGGLANINIPPLAMPSGFPGLPQMPGLPNRLPPRGHHAAGCTVRLRGLPYRASHADILDFFRGYEVIPESVHIQLDGQGRATGDAFVAFVSPDAALRAVREKNRTYIGSRYVELFVV